MVNLSQFGSVPGNLVSNSNYTISILNEIYAAFPSNYFRFTSGYRSPQQNAAANGVSDSYHLEALAGDFVPNSGKFPTSDKVTIEKILSKYGYELVIHNVGSGLHYHIEPAPGWSGISNANNNSISNETVFALGLLAIILLID